MSEMKKAEEWAKENPPFTMVDGLEFISQIQSDALRHAANICQAESRRISIAAGLGRTDVQAGKLAGCYRCAELINEAADKLTEARGEG